MKDCMMSNYPKSTICTIALIAIGMWLGMTSKMLTGVFIGFVGLLWFFYIFQKFIQEKPKKIKKRCHPSH